MWQKSCMEQTLFAVNEQDMKRYHLMCRVIAGKVTLAAAAQALGVSYRQAKRLKARAALGLEKMGHGNRGRAPANKASAELRQQVLALSAEHYRDFNDSHFCQQLAEREGIVVSRDLVRRWRREAGIKAKQQRRPPKHRKRRPRKAAAGLLMLWDGSPHHWFGEAQPSCCLMAAIDDATSSLLALRFVPQECAWGYLKLLEEVLLRWGVPASIYQDRHTIHKRADAFWSLAEELAGRQDPTQVGAALQGLQIEAICALSPQAKGRAERLFRTLQDRLVAELGLAGITDITAANAFLPDFIAAHNGRFALAAQQSSGVWRKAPARAERERLLSRCYPATIGNDNTVRLAGMVIDIPPGAQHRSYARQRVEVRQLLDGSWRVYWHDQPIAEAPATESVELIRAKQRRKGVPAAYDAVYVNLASAPAPARVDPPTAKVRRAGSSGAIGATKIA
jgi:transposase